MDLFGAATGPGMPSSAGTMTSGSPAYQNAIVQNAQRQLAPMYRQALGGMNQNLLSRGMLEGGAQPQAQAQLQQGYLGQLGNIATGAATKGADVAEEQRRLAQQNQWAMQNQGRMFDFQREMQNRQAEQDAANRWASLIGSTVGAVGNVAGYGLPSLFSGLAGGGGAGQAHASNPQNLYGMNLGNY